MDVVWRLDHVRRLLSGMHVAARDAAELAPHACVVAELRLAPVGAEAKAAASIEKACNRTGAKPGCYGPTLDTGADWVGVMEAYSFTGPSLMSRWAQIYCGSPSGAFVN